VSYRIVDAAAFEGRRKPLRRALESSGFALNQFDSDPGVAGFEHDEVESGQEEVYVALHGDGVLRIGEEEVRLEPGRYVLVTPEERRQVVAGDGGLSYLVVGGLRGTFA
jgi:mannose-6-phosphate isomerase-like protein (cupin superfamily)